MTTSRNLNELVVPVERWLWCARCQESGHPAFSMAGPHIRADCSRCGKYLKFVKQVAEHPEEFEPELYVETDKPW